MSSVKAELVLDAQSKAIGIRLSDGDWVLTHDIEDKNWSKEDLQEHLGQVVPKMLADLNREKALKKLKIHRKAKAL